ncbi:MAG: response regulator transcription factor [bacterium]|nr:response regulator transcription factor [bacterium]
MDPTTILLVDDHAMMRQGLVSLLGTCPEFKVIGDVGDGESALDAALRLRPDVIIMDLMMPEMSGAQTTQRLLASWTEAQVLILTTFGTADDLAHALSVGARGAILKSADWNEFHQAITAVAAGGHYISPEIEQIISENPPLPRLSPRQLEILKLMAKGLMNEDIAQILKISLPMVKEHVKALLHKLDAANRTEAVAIALRKYLIES